MKNPLAAALLAGTVVTTALMTPVHAGHLSHAFAAHHGKAMMQTQAGTPARLGVAIAPVSQDALEAMASEYGVRIDQVMPGSVAAESGLQVGDIVTEIDGRPAYSPERMQYLVKQAGNRSVVSVLRGADRMELQVSYVQAAAAAEKGSAVLGVRIQEMTPDLKEAFGTVDRQGVLVSHVIKGSAAERAGLKAGDVLVAISGEAVKGVGDVRNILDEQSAGQTVAIAVVRDRQPSTLNAALDAHPPMAAAGHPRMGHKYRYHGHGKMMKKHCKPRRSHHWHNYHHS
jgi:S1-C subfamily serine protease